MFAIFVMYTRLIVLNYLRYEDEAPFSFVVIPFIQESESPNSCLDSGRYGEFSQVSLAGDSRIFTKVGPFKQLFCVLFRYLTLKDDWGLKIAGSLSVTRGTEGLKEGLTSQCVKDLETFVKGGNRIESLRSKHAKKSKQLTNLSQKKRVGKKRGLTSLEEKFLDDTSAVGIQERSFILVLNDEEFVVGWSSYRKDGSYFNTYGQTYNSSGDKVGGEFKVHSYAPSDHGGLAMVLLVDGSSVAVWKSYRGDKAQYTIYGQ